MSLTLSSAVRSTLADGAVDSIDGGSAAGKCQIYSGSRPAGPGTAITSQTKLAEFTLNDPAFGSASNGAATLSVSPALSATGLAAGTATWARFVTSDGTAVVDCKVSASGGGGDLVLNTTTISVGLSLSLTSGTVTMPAGTAD